MPTHEQIQVLLRSTSMDKRERIWAMLQEALNSSTEDAKRVYRKLALDVHPDRNPSLADAKQLMQMVNRFKDVRYL